MLCKRKLRLQIQSVRSRKRGDMNGYGLPYCIVIADGGTVRSSVAQNGRVFIVTPTLNYKRPDNFANGTLMMPLPFAATAIRKTLKPESWPVGVSWLNEHKVSSIVFLMMNNCIFNRRWERAGAWTLSENMVNIDSIASILLYRI